MVTRRQFEEWGVHRDSVGPAIREIVAVGFTEVTGHGHAGVGGHGEANRFRLTYVNDKHGVEPTHEWWRITDLQEAERIAKEARADKDQRACDLGARGGRATKKKSATVSAPIGHGNHGRKSKYEATETVATGNAQKPWPLSISRTGGGGDVGGDDTQGTDAADVNQAPGVEGELPFPKFPSHQDGHDRGRACVIRGVIQA